MRTKHQIVSALVPIIMAFARLIWVMVSTSVASLWVGVPEARKRIAEDWQKQALDWGIDNIHAPEVYRVTAIVAVIVMVVFWIVCAEITVLVLRLVF